MVRTSAVLCRVRYALSKRLEYERKGVYKVNYPPSVAKGLLDASKTKLVDLKNELYPPPPEWKPPPGMLEDFRIKFPVKKKSIKKKPIWHLSHRISFTEGIDQACLLTKTKRFKGLPPNIFDLVDKYSLDNQDEKIKDLIRHANIWNDTRVKLGKRIDLANVGWSFRREYGIPATKSTEMMLSKFLMLAQTFGNQCPELMSRRILYKPTVETSYDYHKERIEIIAMNEFMVTGRRQLTPLGDDAMVKASTKHKIKDMYPVLPTVDLLKTRTYKECNRGAIRSVLECPCSHPQIVFRINSSNRAPGTNQAFNLMTTFGIAISEAWSRYGGGTGKLEVPVTVMNVNASFNRINFIVFQLNTMDFENDDGIKNFAWFDSEVMFDKVLGKPWLEPGYELKPPVYKNYNDQAFKKFLALYLYDYTS